MGASILKLLKLPTALQISGRNSNGSYSNTNKVRWRDRPSEELWWV